MLAHQKLVAKQNASLQAIQTLAMRESCIVLTQRPAGRHLVPRHARQVGLPKRTFRMGGFFFGIPDKGTLANELARGRSQLDAGFHDYQ